MSPAALLLLVACHRSEGEPKDSATGGPGETAETGGDTADSTPRAALQFRFPVVEADLIEGTPVIGVDHDPEIYGDRSAVCKSYAGTGFPWCYDEHEGSDFLLVGGFDTMDAGSAQIVAAADGVVVAAEDGHYDRCHIEDGAVTCDGNPIVANYVILEHETGDHTLYWHMKEGSVAVAVGDSVSAGDLLGYIGSSGNSSMPHLHFGLEDPDGNVMDPFAGPYSQDETWWCQQGEQGELPGLCSED